ncbi:MAG: glutathione S-transferase family protein [Gammaproteobacteria bacterium]|nr:glutathione S-transferase family protein [Gammaproteobacteria bacterium]MCP5198973.1 glutathione S-transferase family protein [Gammaproteobacteria bacterium]
MKLLDALGPNPRAVRMFLREKQLDLPCEQIDILGAANRRPPFSEFNPGGQLPALLLDDGSCIAETVAICEYLEDLHPAPPLIGSTPREKAETRMWQRRVELNITENLYNAFRYSVGLEMFRERMTCLPEAAPGLARIVQEKLAWLDGLMGRRSWICGERFTLADIILFCALDFGEGAGQPIDPGLINVNAWFARVVTRDSAHDSRHPEGVASGQRGV